MRAFLTEIIVTASPRTTEGDSEIGSLENARCRHGLAYPRRVFTPEERCTVRDLLLERAQDDERITAAAVTGSGSHGAEDRWSDVDLYFGVADGTAREEALDDWTSFVYQELGALHHFDLDAGYAIYRVFFLPGGLEVDIAFAGADRFGPRGPLFRPVFGAVVEQPTADQGGPHVDQLIGLAWHHVLHARTAIARHKPWQAEYWISAVRDHVLTLGCLRSGLPTAYAKGADALPAAITTPLEDALPTSLDPEDLSRALRAAVTALLREVDATDPVLSARMQPALRSLAGDHAGQDGISADNQPPNAPR
jgi:hypothetical protein